MEEGIGLSYQLGLLTNIDKVVLEILLL